jgi:DNA-binding CsgD family transcriptional regulator
MRLLRQQVHCDACIVLWFDARGEISNLYAPNLPAPAVLSTWFRARRASTGSTAPVSAGPRGSRAFITPTRTIEICADGDSERGAGTDHEPEPHCAHRHLCSMAVPAAVPLQRLCSTILRDGRPNASLMLYRTSASAPFSAEERAAVKAASRYLSLHGHATAVDASTAMYRASGDKALLLCESDGRVVQASAGGYELLAQAAGCAINAGTVPHELEYAERELIRRLLADPSRSTAVTNAWGLFRLQVFFDPGGQQGVLIERVEHLLVRLVAAMRTLDLSVQQGEVLLLLAQGLNHERIAERMGVSPNTADYHIRHLYAKLDAHTRERAIGCVLEATESRRAA